MKLSHMEESCFLAFIRKFVLLKELRRLMGHPPQVSIIIVTSKANDFIIFCNNYELYKHVEYFFLLIFFLLGSVPSKV